MHEDEKQIRAVIAEWMEASAAGDTERVLSLMTEDAVFLLPGRPVMRGRTAFLGCFCANAAKDEDRGHV